MRQNVTIAAEPSSADFGRPDSAVARRKIIATLRANALPIAIVAGSLLAGAIYTLIIGEDANWDWQNYHEYTVWSALHGRYGIDVLPAGFQTWFNPAVYFPVYALRHMVPAPWGFVTIGAVHGLNLALVVALTRVLLGHSATAGALAAAVLIAACGPMTLSEVGTSFADILTALPVIAGLILILSADQNCRRRALLAGLLLGAAVGLKLTNVVFAAGAVAAVLLSSRPLKATIWLGLGGAIGALATGGAWSLMLWREMGNPVFPLFNGVFRSKELAPNNIMDLQFMPRDILDALAYPFYWLLGDNRSSEYPFRDARFAMAFVLGLAAIGARLAQRVAILARRDVQFVAFFAVAYAAWLGLFAIQRYAIALELLCGPLIVLLLSRLGSENRWRIPANAALLPVAIAIALWSQPGDWGRRPWSSPYQPEIPAQLRQPAVYFLLDKPIAYVAPLLPPRSRFYQLADVALPVMRDGIFDHRIRAGLADPLPGGVWELHIRGKSFRETLLDRYGLVIDDTRPCVEIEGAQPATAIEACPLTREK
jgi:Glycosyltransferase family 87